ncbi:MAG TPA: O-antigen ligase family protein [Pyrinomonadaceae bacterium]|nr:O-antigen ligase family protein [Pyrinomonadaceae bacterium]
MKFDHHFVDYEPVTRSGRAGLWEDKADASTDETDWPFAHGGEKGRDFTPESFEPTKVNSARAGDLKPAARPSSSPSKKGESWVQKRGHALSYFCLFLFTAILYFRPYELIPALNGFTSMAFVCALITLGVFFPTQLSLEGNLTSRPREVNLVLLLCLCGLLSIPLAISPGEAWTTFNDAFIKAVLMFIVMINVARTERRLKGLFFLALAVSCWLSISALSDYVSGRVSVEGYRVAGRIHGMFENPNDLALHLVTILPIAVALFFTSRGAKKLLYLLCGALMIAATTVTFSRGGFLGLMSVIAVLGWKIGRKHRLAVFLTLFIIMIAFIAFAPGGYADRLGSILDHSRDALGSAGARQDLLIRSIIVTAKHPLLGVGMGNFHIVSIQELVSHNAYTQVSAEMGIIAMVIYIMFIVTPFKRLKRIERETIDDGGRARFYYLSVGLQASLVGYMVGSFFASVAYLWYVYYLVGYSICLRRIYAAAAAAETEQKRLTDPATEISRGGPEVGWSGPQELEAIGR